MADEGQKVTLEFEPVFVPESEIIVPLSKIPVKPPAPTYIPFVPTEKKGIILNIETEGLKPWEGRIISIGLQDPVNPSENPTVIMLDDEAEMLRSLFTIIKDGEYNQMIGYGLSFDLRYIVIRSMYHQIPCKEFAEIDIYDLMQAMAQVKFEFVYFAQKPPKLSDIADFFWSYPKPFSDLEMLKYYKAGRFDKVLEFTSSQIVRIMLLYYLFKNTTESDIHTFTSGIVGSRSASTTPAGALGSSPLTIPEANLPETHVYKCSSCLAEFVVPKSEKMELCRICGRKLNEV